MPRSTHTFSPDAPGSNYCRCGLQRDELDHQHATIEGGPRQEAAASNPGIRFDSGMVASDREAELLDRINKILTDVGAFAHCKGCARAIFWVKSKRGSNVPYTPEGINHFIDCPNANEFRKSVNR